MKTLIKSLALVAVIASAALVARAGDYAVQKTLWNVGSVVSNTWILNTATNLNAVVDCTQVTDFTLNIKVGLTNASAGLIGVNWETSADNTWPGTNTYRANGGSFSFSTTNMHQLVNWSTNITMNSLGYWRLAWLTNDSVQHATSAVVRAYIKPKRTNRDY
jgi:hypothetical protein